MVAVLFFGGFSIGADSVNYYVFTSSLLVDQDLDLTNQWVGLGGGGAEHGNGHSGEPHVGRGACLSPGVALAHAWLLVTGGRWIRCGCRFPLRGCGATTLAVLLFALLVASRGRAGLAIAHSLLRVPCNRSCPTR